MAMTITRPRAFHHFRLLAALGALGWCLLAPQALRAEENPIFVPTSAWLVGPASLAIPAGGGKLPCVMINQFDNGFTLRISAGGKRVFALAVDVRQAAFTPGQDYPVALRLGKDYAAKFDGVAYNSATLIVNTQGDDQLYDVIQNNPALAMDIAGQTFEFAILGVRDGVKRLEACYDPGTQSGPDHGEGYAMPPPAPSLMEDGGEGDMRISPPNALPDLKSVENAAPSGIEPAAGDPLADILEEEAPVDGKAIVTGWQPPAAKAGGGSQRDIMEPVSGAALAAGADVEKRWRALKGANLRDVLEIWAKNAETDLVWMPDANFPVKESVIRQGALEAAVLELLQQYDGDGVRPVGKLYNDPAMNRRVLLIRSEQGT